MPDTTPVWENLAALAQEDISISDQFADDSRLARYSVTLEGLYLDVSKHLVTDTILEALLELAASTDVLARARQMIEGQQINTSEHRAALHMALRQESPSIPGDFPESAQSERDRMKIISGAIRNGEWCGVTGMPITDVINIGIGGSDLGPKMVCQALEEFSDGPTCHFISNVDGAEIFSLIKDLDAASTLIVISSKSFTTRETLLNAKTALEWLGDALALSRPQDSPHCIGITSDIDTATQFGIPASRLLVVDESIGGRYSVWSAVGLPICIATGYENFQAMLQGGAAMDAHFLGAPPNKNMPILMAMLGIWYNNFLNAETYAVIPYCQRLDLFVDYLQQLDMESSGKSATVAGTSTDINTGPVVWGQTGTNGQHAFFQLFHQGTKLIPIDFIGTVTDGLSNEEHHRVLLANMIAQSQALMTGKASEDRHQHYEGNKPSTTLLLDQLNPRTLGMLIALYEHKVFVQGTVWGINSFDQWGVELGKRLTDQILQGSVAHDPSTNALMKKAGFDVG